MMLEKTMLELGKYSDEVPSPKAEALYRKHGVISLEDEAWLWALAKITWPPAKILPRRKDRVPRK